MLFFDFSIQSARRARFRKIRSSPGTLSFVGVPGELHKFQSVLELQFLAYRWPLIFWFHQLHLRKSEIWFCLRQLGADFCSFSLEFWLAWRPLLLEWNSTRVFNLKAKFLFYDFRFWKHSLKIHDSARISKTEFNSKLNFLSKQTFLRRNNSRDDIFLFAQCV